MIGFAATLVVCAAAQETPTPEAPAPAAVVVPPVPRYRLDPARSVVAVIARNDTAAPAARLGRDVAVRAADFQGEVAWSTTDAKACLVDITVPIASLAVDTASSLVGGAWTAADVATTTENLRSSRLLDMTGFPTATFHAASCSGTSGRVKVTGALTVRGQSTPLTLWLDVRADEGSFSAKGSVTVTHASLGLPPWTMVGGAVRVADPLRIVVDVAGSPAG